MIIKWLYTLEFVFVEPSGAIFMVRLELKPKRFLKWLPARIEYHPAPTLENAESLAKFLKTLYDND